MFETLTDKLSKSFRNFVGRGKFTDENTKQTLLEVKHALIEADVALEVVHDFIEDLRENIRGLEINAALTPAQALVKVVNAQLVSLMGESAVPLNLSTQPPAVILMAGLQGSGKTTSTAKLALLLIEQFKKSVLLVSTDVYRPSAIEQLRVLSAQVGAHFFESEGLSEPAEILEKALQKAKQQLIDVVLVDTAGRLHVDDKMMHEIQDLHQRAQPVETLFVVDGMMGQDAAKAAKTFHEAIPLTGLVVTKLDGDTRGGAVLSTRKITGKPIKFIGMGEKITALDIFHPDRMASRILGMGDVLSLVEELESKVDKKEADRVAKKLRKGKGFDLEDFRSQLLQMKNMGGVAGLLDKMPGVGALPPEVKARADDRMLDKMLAMIQSMTPRERERPALIQGSRKRRIARGSGTEVHDVNSLIKKYNQMQKMMQKMTKKGGLARMMRGMKGLQNLLPGGGMPH